MSGMDEKHEAKRAEATIKMLEREKAGYKTRDLPDRVKQVDAEIARIRKAKRVDANLPEVPAEEEPKG